MDTLLKHGFNCLQNVMPVRLRPHWRLTCVAFLNGCKRISNMTYVCISSDAHVSNLNEIQVKGWCSSYWWGVVTAHRSHGRACREQIHCIPLLHKVLCPPRREEGSGDGREDAEEKGQTWMSQWGSSAAWSAAFLLRVGWIIDSHRSVQGAWRPERMHSL